jgi:hypothetical protein
MCNLCGNMNSLRNHLVLCVAVWCLIEVRLLSADLKSMRRVLVLDDLERVEQLLLHSIRVFVL